VRPLLVAGVVELLLLASPSYSARGDSGADVQVSKTGPATARPGSDITYTLDYSNTGPDTASNVQVSDTLPAGETFKSFSFLNGATAPPSSCGLGQTISCSTASMPAGSHVQAVITVTINPATSDGTVLNNTATETADTIDPNPANNSSTASTTVIAPRADLALTKTASPDPAFVGDTITYTLTVTNNGPDASSGGTVTDTLPASVAYVSDDDGCANVASTVTCATGALGNGASKVLHIVVTASTPGGATNTASVKGNEVDDRPANNTATATSQIKPKNADLSAAKTGPAFAQSGGTITYQVAVRDAGPADATGVTVNDPLPAGESLVSATPSQGTCSDDVTCSLGSIPNGGSATIAVVVRVTAACGSTLVNTASVKGDQPDDNTSNNTSSTSAFVYCVAAGGSFVISDKSASVGNTVTFWSAQWWTANTLTGGAAPAAFKGFANAPAAPACGTTWSTAPGNSAPPPPGPLPSYMAVIVSSSIGQAGSTIAGNTVHIVVVKTNSGYAPDPGHAGTGTVVAELC